MIEKLNNGKFDISEFYVLQDIAYHSFTTSKSLIFEGAVKDKEDTKSCSLQSSINRLYKDK